MPITELVSAERVKAHLRAADDDFGEGELEALIQEGSNAVIDYLKTPVPAEWTLDTVPPRIRSAVLLAIGTLYADREGATDPITPAVVSLLRRSRDPAVA